MVRLSEITKAYREAGALNSLISLYATLDEHTFLTKAGHILQVVQVHGVDHECLDHPQLDQIARRFEAAMRIFPTSFRVYQLMMKRDHAELPHRDYTNATVQRAVKNRVEYLTTKADSLYTLDLFFVFVFEPDLTQSALANKVRQMLRDPGLLPPRWFCARSWRCWIRPLSRLRSGTWPEASHPLPMKPLGF